MVCKAADIYCIKLETVYCKVYHKEQMTQTTTKQHQAAADFVQLYVELVVWWPPDYHYKSHG